MTNISSMSRVPADSCGTYHLAHAIHAIVVHHLWGHTSSTNGALAQHLQASLDGIEWLANLQWQQ
jgi:hypothetical protein